MDYKRNLGISSFMENPVRFDRLLTKKTFLSIIYLIMCGAVFFTLNQNRDPLWNKIYFLCIPAMLMARMSSAGAVRAASSIIYLSIIITGGILSPMPLELIEEGFIFIPLSILILYPGRFWSVLCAFSLLLPYWFGFSDEPLVDLMEDALELVVITIIASVMVYFQRGYYKQMLNYRKESLTDYLTQFQNRLSFILFLKNLYKQPVDVRRNHVLLLIDIDNFKTVNDLYGHSAGDLLLRQFSRRLENIEDIHRFRIGGDEFAVIIEDKTSDSNASRKLTERIQHGTSKSYELLDHVVNISISIGISRCIDTINSYEDFVHSADLALFYAKKCGKSKYIFYENSMLKNEKYEDHIARELVHALSGNQFHLIFQPKVDMRDGRIIGAEALLRWNHPDLGLIPPYLFIPIAEANRQIISIGKWVTEQACKMISQWMALGLEIPISINVSPVQLEYDDMLSFVKDMFKKYEIKPELLEIEITETSIMNEIDEIVPVLEKIRAERVNILVDDFGVAYSSLNQLVRLPVNILKIDKSFVDNCHSEVKDRVLIRAIIQLAHSLNMKLVAEGVESDLQRDILLEEGCSVAQGYYYYKPINADELIEILRKQARTGV